MRLADGLIGGRIDCFRTTVDPRCELDILPLGKVTLSREASKQLFYMSRTNFRLGKRMLSHEPLFTSTSTLRATLFTVEL